jgi:hypothetical protein
MAVTKRIRFEVLKRDNYTCRYCRSVDNELVVDHVTPLALGGSDQPSNLVAACKDCNSGKSSTSPDAAVVAAVSDQQVLLARNIELAYEIVANEIVDREDYLQEFRNNCPIDLEATDWEITLRHWHSLGVPREIPIDAARIAYAKGLYGARKTYAYMCGVVWNQVGTVRDKATEATLIDRHILTQQQLSEVRIDAYEAGIAWADEHPTDEGWTRIQRCSDG